MGKHNPDHVAQVAAVLLQGKFDAEPHHVRQATVTARLILDEASDGEDVADIEPAPAPEADTQ